jgi:tRNA-dihydrouridine synthase B
MQLKPIQIGNIEINCPVILAPMTGVTDMPFRKIVRLWVWPGRYRNDRKSAMIHETRQSRRNANGMPLKSLFPCSWRCTLYEMGEAALNEDRGAAIIDINMAAPSKVVNGDAGSARARSALAAHD